MAIIFSNGIKYQLKFEIVPCVVLLMELETIGKAATTKEKIKGVRGLIDKWTPSETRDVVKIDALKRTIRVTIMEQAIESELGEIGLKFHSKKHAIFYGIQPLIKQCLVIGKSEIFH
jgi:hypothetical protein